MLPLAATWLLAFGAVAAFLWPLAMLYDSDSYYHLAIARAYLQRGVFSDLPWARFSAMHEGFGDKEFLFHVLLLPAAAMRDPVLGAKLTLAALDATILTTLAHLSMRAAGPRALAVPALALIGSFWFDMRMIRLRPELLALLLLLWTVHALSERRPLLAAACACAFALGYTAFHALLGICGLCFALRFALDRKPDWTLLLGPTAGVLLGLVLHPHFPQSLRIAYLQNVEFWRYQNEADIGNEILPLGFWRWLRYDAPLLLGCATLLATLRRAAPLERAERDAGLVVCAAALPLVLLFVHSGRFAVYGVPFGLLAGLWCTRLCGYQLQDRLWPDAFRKPGPSAVLVLLLNACIFLPRMAAELHAQVDRDGCVWPAQRQQLEAIGRALPEAAKVAATWDSSEDLMYFAPQGRYLNVLDPLFMRAAHPREYRAQRELFEGQQQDVPLTLQADLDSEFLAFSARDYARLQAQVARDPRLEPVVSHGFLLYRVVPERARAFVRDYRVARSREQSMQPTAAQYPRHPHTAGRDIEGVIDASRLAPSLLTAAGCLWFAPQPTPAHVRPGEYEIASTAPGRAWIGARSIATLQATTLLLGEGTRLQLSAAAELTIEVCPVAGAAPSFYLIRRSD